MEGPNFATLDLCQVGEEPCLTAADGSVDEIYDEYFNTDTTRTAQGVPIQIFPDPIETHPGAESSTNCLNHDQHQDCDHGPDHEKKRLPSIVVEPTDVSEVESGELRWPPDTTDSEENEEDLFLEQCIPPANIADWGEEEESEEEEEASVITNHQQGLTLIDFQSDAFRDDTPILPPSSAPNFN